MYNVIVADDEKNIREGIVELIEWEKLGCKVCASMQNGAQVLKYLENHPFLLPIAWISRISTYIKDRGSISNVGLTAKETIAVGNKRIDLLKEYKLIR